MKKIGSDGTAQIYFRSSSLDLSFAFLSQNLANFFPNSSTLESCSSNFVISDMVFDGSISATVANTFEQTVRGAVQSNVNSLICQQISEAQTEVTDVLSKIHEQIETFLPSNNSWSDEDVDPLQTSIVIPNNTTLVDFANNTAIGLLVTQMNSFLYIGIDSVDSSNTGINSFIRSNFLLLAADTTTTDDESHYYYNVPVDQFFTDSTVLKTEDRLTKSQITINSIKIFGLDEFTEFHPPSPIAPQVLQSSFVLTSIGGWK